MCVFFCFICYAAVVDGLGINISVVLLGFLVWGCWFFCCFLLFFVFVCVFFCFICYAAVVDGLGINIQYARAPNDFLALTTYVGVTGARCSSVVIAFAHGAMGRRINTL